MSGGAPRGAEATQGASYTGHFSIGGCTSNCTVAPNSQFTVDLNVDTWTAAYDGISIDVISGTGTCVSASAAAMATAWPGRFDLSSCIASNEGEAGASKGVNDTSTSQKGKVGQVVFNCTQSGAISLDASSFMVNSATGGSDPITMASLDVSCQAASTPTLTPTRTSGPTLTPTPTGTGSPSTSPPGVEKCAEKSGPCTNNMVKFVTEKFRPDVCPKSLMKDTQLLWERLTPSAPPGVGAFQIEIRFDPKLVCIGIIGLPPTHGSTPYSCFVFDDIHPSTGPAGVARIGCVIVGKGAGWDPGMPIAILGIALQPDMAKLMGPTQDNGILVKIIDQDCTLADEQGKPLRSFYCADADILFRYLEADVIPDCIVNALDVQDIAYRWGATTTNIRYKREKDLVPAGGDGVIDIQDLQFVYGRFGSTCEHPWPPTQLPPKK